MVAERRVHRVPLEPRPDQQRREQRDLPDDRRRGVGDAPDEQQRVGLQPDWSPDGAEIVCQRFSYEQRGHEGQRERPGPDQPVQQHRERRRAGVGAERDEDRVPLQPGRRLRDLHVRAPRAERRRTADDEHGGRAGPRVVAERRADQIAFTTRRAPATTRSTRCRGAAGRRPTAPTTARATPARRGRPTARSRRRRSQSGPTGPVAELRPSFRFALVRAGLDVPVPHRRRGVRGLHLAVRPVGEPRARASTPSRCARPTRPATSTPRPRPARSWSTRSLRPVSRPSARRRCCSTATRSRRVTATDATSGMAAIDDPSGEHELDTSVPGVQQVHDAGDRPRRQRRLGRVHLRGRLPEPGHARAERRLLAERRRLHPRRGRRPRRPSTPSATRSSAVTPTARRSPTGRRSPPGWPSRASPSPPAMPPTRAPGPTASAASTPRTARTPDGRRCPRPSRSTRRRRARRAERRPRAGVRRRRRLVRRHGRRHHRCATAIRRCATAARRPASTRRRSRPSRP